MGFWYNRPKSWWITLRYRIICNLTHTKQFYKFKTPKSTQLLHHTISILLTWKAANFRGFSSDQARKKKKKWKPNYDTRTHNLHTTLNFIQPIHIGTNIKGQGYRSCCIKIWSGSGWLLFHYKCIMWQNFPCKNRTFPSEVEHTCWHSTTFHSSGVGSAYQARPSQPSQSSNWGRRPARSAGRRPSVW